MDNVERKVKDQVKLVAERHQEKKIKYLGSLKLKKGLTLYEFNFDTQELKPAGFEATDIHYSVAKKGGKPHRKLIVNERCTYLPALNKKNAMRKLIKQYGPSKNT